MALDPIVNFFRSTIATLPVASGGTSIVLQTGDGNKLPAPAIDGAFNLTIYNADDPFVAPEIVRVTARSGDTLTVTRAQEGTSATNKTAGSTWNVELTPTAKTIQDIDDKKLDVAGGTMTGDLTATKLIPSGNVTAGNGMYLPTTNQVAIGTNGTEAIRVNASQNVGLKTTTPRSALDVNGDVHIVDSKIIQKTVTCTNATATNLITVTPGGATRSFAVEILVQANRTVSTRVSVVAKYLFTYIVGPVGNVQTKLNAILAPDFITQNTALQNYASIAVTVETTSGDGRAVAINFTSEGSNSPFDTTARIFATVMGTNLSEVT